MKSEIQVVVAFEKPGKWLSPILDLGFCGEREICLCVHMLRIVACEYSMHSLENNHSKTITHSSRTRRLARFIEPHFALF